MCWVVSILEQFRRVTGAIIIFLMVIALCGVVALFSISDDPEKDRLIRTQRALNLQFSASSKFIVFPVVLPGKEIGLIWVDRSTHAKKLIHIDGAGLFSPSISEDNERLLFVKNNDESSSKEVIRCSIASWKCSKLFALDMAIRSPIEIGDGVLLSASELTQRQSGQKRYESFDFFYFDATANALAKITEFKLYELESLQYVKPKIYFSAERFTIGNQGSGIYSLDFDEQRKRFVVTQPLEPLILPNRLKATSSACSERCSLLALLSLTSTQYNLLVLKSGVLSEVTKRQAGDLSRPSVIDSTVVVNELFKDEYVTTAYRLDQPSEVWERLPRSPEKLEKLESIPLLLDN
jgi:hypothetical protein